MTPTAPPEQDRHFTPPGDGAWVLDTTRVHKPLTGMLRDIFAAGVGEGMSAACARYGLLLERHEIRFVHGFPYQRPKPVGAKAGKKPPPEPVFKLLARVHPSIRRRVGAARDLFERKPWREELRAWDEAIKPRTIEAHRSIDAVDVIGLPDGALAEHVARVASHATRTLKQDHDLTLTYAVPLGDFLANASDWTRLSEAELLALFRGASRISSGDSRERRRLLSALGDAPDARDVLESELPASEILERLAARPDTVGDAMRAWLVVFGNCIIHGLDLTVPSAREAPGPLIAALRRAADAAPRPPTDPTELLARVRERVQPARRPAFDELFAEARATYRVRDERHVYGVLPTLGLARRAALEVGRRLVERRALPEATLAVHADVAELRALLVGRGPSRAELEARADEHARLDATRAPATLGGAVSPPPPPEWLPNEGARRVARAVKVFLGAVEHGGAAPRGAMIRGLGISRGSCRGVARVCASAEELDALAPGDVLVAPTTTPAINAVLPLLGAIVTDRGGALCHAAIVAREYGIPGVVGTRDATARISDGACVEVDGDAGTVTVLA